MPDGTHGPSQASETALEERLRNALSGAAPEGYATIGVREKIVGSVRARVRRRQHIAGALAACCLVIAGASAGVAALHTTQNHGSKSAAALAPEDQKRPQASAPRNSGSVALRTNCGEIAEGFRLASGCYGVYDRSPDLSANAIFGYDALGASSPTPPLSKSTTLGRSFGGAARSASKDATKTQKAEPRDGSYRVLVPLGETVTVNLPGTAGEIWSAPAVALGQGSAASRVRITRENSAGVGEGSSASFESDVAVTVLIDASALGVCGSLHIPCGAPLSTWFLVLEFQKS